MGAIVQAILAAAPSVISAIQQAHAQANPGAPPLTPEEIHAAFEQIYGSTILKDEMIKAALAAKHPPAG